MMPRGPLADDWLFWDPETIFTYPHSDESGEARSDFQAEFQDVSADIGEPSQLDLFATYP